MRNHLPTISDLAAAMSVRPSYAVLAVAAVVAIGVAACSKPAPNASGVSNASDASSVVADSNSLDAAFHVAFPKGATETVPADTINGPSLADGYPLTFVPKLIVPVADDVVALVSEGSSDDACHACDGKLKVTYLRQTDDRYARVQPAVSSLLAGNGFGGPPTWKVITDGGMPALRLETAYGEQGCSESSVAVYLLKPDGVVEDKAASKAGAETCE